MRVRSLALVLGLGLLWTTSARADNDFGVVTATNAAGVNSLSVETGFPGFTFGFAHGLGGGTDIGFKFDLDYSPFSAPAWPTQFGLIARVPIRFTVLHQDMLNLILHVDPGLFVDAGTDSVNTLFGITVQPGMELAFQIIPKLRVGFGVDLPMYIQLVNGAFFVISPMFGPNIEYAVTPRVVLGLNTRFGPTIFTASGAAGGTGTIFGFVTEATFGFKL